jgi:hypothetical protein
VTIDLVKTRARAARMVTDQRSPTVGLTVQLSRETYNSFIMYAAKRGKSNSAALRELVERFVDEKNHAVPVGCSERWAHTKTGTKALGGPEKVAEWDAASKGKKLPARKKRKEKLGLAKGIGG